MSSSAPPAGLPAVGRPPGTWAPGQRWRRLALLLRRHTGLLIVLGIGLVARALVMVAYPQAFWYTDASRYLLFSYGWRPDFARQAGYSLLLKILRQTGSLYSVSTLQHILGLAIAVGVYALLQRRSVPRWASILAVTPVVLDSFQIGVEHYVLADTAFTALVVGGLLALLWPSRPSVVSPGLAGLLLAISATFRVVSLPLVVLTIAYLVIRRTGWRSCVAYAACAAVPLLGYAVWFHHSYDRYSFTTISGLFLYGRVAPVAFDGLGAVPGVEIARVCEKPAQ